MEGGIENECGFGNVAVDAAGRSHQDTLPCSLVVSDWQTTLISYLRHAFQLGKYCDLVIQFSDGNSIKVHRVVLESYCSLQHVGKTCEEDPGVVVAHPHVTAALLCPLIRFLYTGMISLTSSQLHMARVIQLTLLLDCARKLGLRDSVSFDLNYEEKQNQETSSRSPSVQSAHLGGGAASRSDVIAGTSVVVHEAENVFQSNHSLPIERDHSDENFFCARIHNSNSVCSPTVSSRESLVTFQTEMRHLDSGMSVCADASMEIDSNNTNEKNVNDGELYTDCTVTSNHAVSDSPLIQTQTEKLSSGVKQLGTSCFYDNSCVSSVPSTDCQFPKSINSKSNEISFVNPSQITVSTCKSKSSTSLLSESQFENALEGLHPSLHDHSFGSLNKFHQKTSALSSSPVVSSTLSASKSLCTSGDIFSHATVIHSTSPTVMKYSLSSASNPNNGRVQSSCDSAFDALLLGEPEKQSSAETPSSIVASSTAG
ncbi:BTB/POZ domain [Trinorchestia longiramus]|nr:BTB/POZ domain [Trinorchestia longiramus]